MTVGIRMSAEPVRRAAAFTIVELLVVIAIVAVVVSIAVPAYRHVSGNARLSMEMSAARQ
ncbi:MAG: prepilin-type N-terminal cleavage/methylation domain-containing protein, partial [Phycisphaerae bacterium]|nr:prepilin-type N-terminal cleavage/methylation domain-containing protein [Phycisphaerae bacterium]